MNTPFHKLRELPGFQLTSTDITSGGKLPAAQCSGIMGIAGGGDVSPQLAWSGFPPETQAFVVTCFDPDAPTGSGFWHWTVANIPGDVHELATDAGNPDKNLLPAGAITIRNDAGSARFIGAAPPAGHGPHRYFFIVQALDAPLDVDASATPAFVGFNTWFHAIGRAWLEATFEVPA